MDVADEFVYTAVNQFIAHPRRRGDSALVIPSSARELAIELLTQRQNTPWRGAAWLMNFSHDSPPIGFAGWRRIAGRNDRTCPHCGTSSVLRSKNELFHIRQCLKCPLFRAPNDEKCPHQRQFLSPHLLRLYPMDYVLSGRWTKAQIGVIDLTRDMARSYALRYIPLDELRRTASGSFDGRDGDLGTILAELADSVPVGRMLGAAEILARLDGPQLAEMILGDMPRLNLSRPDATPTDRPLTAQESLQLPSRLNDARDALRAAVAGSGGPDIWVCGPGGYKLNRASTAGVLVARAAVPSVPFDRLRAKPKIVVAGKHLNGWLARFREAGVAVYDPVTFLAETASRSVERTIAQLVLARATLAQDGVRQRDVVKISGLDKGSVSHHWGLVNTLFENGRNVGLGLSIEQDRPQAVWMPLAA